MKYRSLVFSLLIIMCLGSSIAVLAEESSQNSDANVEFTSGNSITPPVNPDKPEENNEEEKDNGTGATGPLSIDFISTFTFKAEISGGAELYPTSVKRPYIQVSDTRGSDTGWKLYASMGKFVDEAEAEALPDTTVRLLNGRVNSVKPTYFPPEAEETVVLDQEKTRVLVMSADDGYGKGTWVNRWYPENNVFDGSEWVLLDVPFGSATIGNFSASIEWILTDAP